MRMSDFIVREAIVPDLKAATRGGVIRELVESLGAAGQFKGGEPEDIVQAILRREALGSTGIGHGVAIPHSKHPAVVRVVGTVGVSQRGVAFESPDGQPVHVLVLLVSPPGQPGEHLRALECASRALRDEDLVRSLRQAGTGDAIWALLGQREARP
jgi:mannitol/fructose-specific phosphotransferase system IIA component (Ntr-type)